MLKKLLRRAWLRFMMLKAERVLRRGWSWTPCPGAVTHPIAQGGARRPSAPEPLLPYRAAKEVRRVLPLHEYGKVVL